MPPGTVRQKFLYLLKIGFHIATQLLSVQKGHRIDCYVVMQVVLIQMRTDDHLEPLTEQPPANSTPMAWVCSGVSSPGLNDWMM